MGKFKVRGSDTIYILGELMNDHYEIYWTNSSGEHRIDLKDVSWVMNQFEKGDWYYLETEANVLQGVKPDAVNSPKHYAVFEKLEAIEVIASSMTADQFYGYCLGNILKYRLRAGGKDDVMQELGKADKYQELFTKYKYLCKGL